MRHAALSLGLFSLLACGAEPATHDEALEAQGEDVVDTGGEPGDVDPPSDEEEPDGDVDEIIDDDISAPQPDPTCQRGALDQTVSVDTVEALAALEGYSQIKHLTISGQDITSLAPLHCLSKVDMTLWLSFTALPDTSGLEALESIGNELVIEDNSVLTSFVGLEHLAHVATNIWIEDNPRLDACEIERIKGVWAANGVDAFYVISNNKTPTCDAP